MLGTHHISGDFGREWLFPAARAALKRLDRRVAVSAAAREAAESAYGGEYEVLWNGVAVDELAAGPAWPAEGPAVLFCNRHEPRKGLGVLLDAWRFSGRRDGERRELDEVRVVRDRMREIWTLERDEMAEVVNAILEETNATPKLMRHDDLDWHIHAVSQESPLAERMLVEAAMALVDVVRADETRRLARCDADDCTGVFLDLSKNASRRYCSVRCGNRMAARAYRARAEEAAALVERRT